MGWVGLGRAWMGRAWGGHGEGMNGLMNGWGGQLGRGICGGNERTNE